MKILWVLGAKGSSQGGLPSYSLPYIAELEKRGYAIDTLSTPPALEPGKKILLKYLLLAYLLLRKSRRYDKVVLWAEDYALLAPFIRTQSILIVHHIVEGVPYDKTLREKLHQSYEKIFISKFDKIVTVSDFTRQRLLTYQYLKNPSNCKIIYSPIDDNRYKEFHPATTKVDLFARYEIPYHPEMIYLLNVGSEVARKNVITLLHLMNEIKDQNYHLIKIGASERDQNRQMHLEYIKEKKLENVTFIDCVDEDTLLSFYSCSDLFLFPSLYEGFGKPPIEAQALGLPVISTHEGALGEVLDHSALMIKYPMDVEEWKQALAQMRNPEERSRLIEAGYKNIQRFSFEQNLPHWEELLR